MKIIQFLVSLEILLILNSCGGDPIKFNVQRVIVNSSTVPITWTVFEDGEIFESISLPIGSEDRKSEQCISQVEPSRYSCDHLTGQDVLLRRQDSVVIVFNTEKKLVYCVSFSACENGNKNIMLGILPDIESEDIIGFEREIQGNGERIYTFSITEEDYENAEPIDG